MSAIEKFLPQEGFLRDYVEYAYELTDAPSIYHLFTGLVLISMAIGNKCYLPFGALNIYPNLYVLILGPSSFFRKTYSISIGRHILERVDENLCLPDEFSLEKLIEKLSENPQGLLIWPEFGATLQYFERSYMLGAKEFITDLFDCRPRYVRELKGNKYVIERPCVSILAASTPEWLTSRVRGDDIKGGFFSRFIYVTATKKEKRVAIPPEPNKTFENRMIIALNKFREMSGSFDIEEIKGIYEEWIFQHEDEALEKENREVLSGFYTRLGIYALKLAMLFQISSFQDLTISTESMLKSIALIKLLKTNLAELLAYDLVGDKDMRDKAKVKRIIDEQPGIKKGNLLSRSHLMAKRLDEIVSTLGQEEKIEVKYKGKAVYYYPTRQKKVSNKKSILDIVKASGE